jgi:hypothetical protein
MPTRRQGAPTSGGPARKMVPLPFTITHSSDIAGTYAPPAVHDPMTREICGVKRGSGHGVQGASWEWGRWCHVGVWGRWSSTWECNAIYTHTLTDTHTTSQTHTPQRQQQQQQQQQQQAVPTHLRDSRRRHASLVVKDTAEVVTISKHLRLQGKVATPRVHWVTRECRAMDLGAREQGGGRGGHVGQGER